MILPRSVKVVEVGPRDGLQNEPKPVERAVKVELIRRLASAGLPVVEAGSFVDPRRVPQMAETGEVLAALPPLPLTRLPVLVPNLRGLEDARAAGALEIAVFAAASESFSLRNLNCSVAESLERYEKLCARAADYGMSVRGYVSCVLGCPYEGEIPFARVAEVAARLFELGCTEISLGDTIGVGTPGKARELVEKVARQVPAQRLAVHFHDTYGQALANVLAVLPCGVAAVDSSVAGLGGCPFAPGAAGNLATEDLLYMLHGLGIETGVDLTRVIEAGRFITDYLGRPTRSRVAQAMLSGKDQC